ncbi:dimethylhistidine N-methyltransferase [Bradyrhizobium sp. S3.14.4]
MNVHASALAEAHLPDEQTTAFAREAIEDLSQQPKKLSPKYFYDATGSELFEAITRLPEYYPTRTELAILKERGSEIAKIIPQHAALVEFGAGATTKVRLLLDHCKFAAYVPVDISGDFLKAQANGLKRDFPTLGIYPVAADFTTPFELPKAVGSMPKVGFFPGSTIGNFEPHEAQAFLKSARKILGKGAQMIIGADLEKEERVLHDAYNDAAGVTARFNLNVLVRINRELGGKFRPVRLYPSRDLQPRAAPDRDASDQQEEPDRAPARHQLLVPPRREHPHREQLQVQPRAFCCAGAGRGLAGARKLDGRGEDVFGARAGGGGVSAPLNLRAVSCGTSYETPAFGGLLRMRTERAATVSTGAYAD